ncbi:uncharacterized protein TRIADDRAFT_53342 [Trichoplax adhaerens]|uniref:Uncharacterized protein n=1 Tax=Trichoplax adhaerens TaxID=10228 RepID=B3RNZ0_TRIAD|nr:predicted protein [Trichoplax adhaerens]EDV28099.1 predicted protein [Trichoplax adhaerens]|eukprot:XP_002109933.1 predicted protein [Trichoplax adhaerens]
MPRSVFEMNPHIIGGELASSRENEALTYTTSPRFRYERKLPTKLIRLNKILAERRKANNEKVASAVVKRSCQTQRNQPISIAACIESRPPLPFDLSGPTPLTYHPPNKHPHDRNAPSFSMGKITKASRGVVSPDSGEKYSIGKEWSSHADVWTIKTDFSSASWPSSACIALPSTIGASAADEPSPNKYHTGLRLNSQLQRAPAYAFGTEKGKNVWLRRDKTPGPGTYMPQIDLCKPSSPAYSIRGPSNSMLLHDRSCEHPISSILSVFGIQSDSVTIAIIEEELSNNMLVDIDMPQFALIFLKVVLKCELKMLVYESYSREMEE